jgi:hypothetical protein
VKAQDAQGFSVLVLYSIFHILLEVKTKREDYGCCFCTVSIREEWVVL